MSPCTIALRLPLRVLLWATFRRALFELLLLLLLLLPPCGWPLESHQSGHWLVALIFSPWLPFMNVVPFAETQETCPVAKKWYATFPEIVCFGEEIPLALLASKSTSTFQCFASALILFWTWKHDSRRCLFPQKWEPFQNIGFYHLLVTWRSDGHFSK